MAVLTLDPQGHLWILGPSHGSYTTESFISRAEQPYTDTGLCISTSPCCVPQPWWTGLGFAHFPHATTNAARFVVHSGRRYLADHAKSSWRISNAEAVKSVRMPSRATALVRSLTCTPRGWKHGVIYVTHKPMMVARLGPMPADRGCGSAQEQQNGALVLSTKERGDLVYLKDLVFDAAGNPVALYLTSKQNLSGPQGGLRQWWMARLMAVHGPTRRLPPVITTTIWGNSRNRLMAAGACWRQ